MPGTRAERKDSRELRTSRILARGDITGAVAAPNAPCTPRSTTALGLQKVACGSVADSGTTARPRPRGSADDSGKHSKTCCRATDRGCTRAPSRARVHRTQAAWTVGGHVTVHSGPWLTMVPLGAGSCQTIRLPTSRPMAKATAIARAPSRTSLAMARLRRAVPKCALTAPVATRATATTGLRQPARRGRDDGAET